MDPVLENIAISPNPESSLMDCVIAGGISGGLADSTMHVYVL